MTVVRVRSHPGLFIQDCLQALPLVPWALSSSSCVLRFPLPLILKVSQYILYQSVVLFLLLITMNYCSQSTVYIKVYSWCCTTMHVYVIHSTFWYPGLLRTLFIWCLWSRLWHRTPLFVREVADADGFGTPWRHGDWWQMARVHHDIYVKHVCLPRDEKLLTLAQQAWYSFGGSSLRKINPTVTTQRDKKDHMTVFHW